MGRTPILNVLYNTNILLELVILILFFRDSYSTKKRNMLFIVLATVCVVSGVVSVFLFGFYAKFLTEWLCVNNLMYTAWTLILLYDLYDNDEKLSELAPSLLCYLSGLFLYSSCTMLIFSFWYYIMTKRDSYLNNLWIIHDLFNIFMYLIFSFGFFIEIKARHLTRKNGI